LSCAVKTYATLVVFVSVIDWAAGAALPQLVEGNARLPETVTGKLPEIDDPESAMVGLLHVLGSGSQKACAAVTTSVP
jgi:hypothetical protein